MHVHVTQNAGSKYAGSITAALFLQQYVDTEKVQWAHIDIAGYAPVLFSRHSTPSEAVFQTSANAVHTMPLI